MIRSVPALPLLVLVAVASAPARAEDLGRDLAALSRASVRPSECGGTASAARWTRARVPKLGQYCDYLARGYALLASDPKQSVDFAKKAEESLPGRIAPSLLEARSDVTLGAYEEAWAAFERARSRGGLRVDSPSMLHALGVAALRTRHVEAALVSYRALVSRVELLDDSAEQLRILIEAAALTMNQGPAHLAEAVGYLTEARRRLRVPGLSDYVAAALAMALDLQGLSTEANGMATEATGPWQLEGDRERIGKAKDLPELPAGMIDAMTAMLSEHHDRDLALERWQSYLESDSSRPFASWAEQRRDALLGKAKRKKPKP